jgi:hypothetical protein
LAVKASIALTKPRLARIENMRRAVRRVRVTPFSSSRLMGAPFLLGNGSSLSDRESRYIGRTPHL